MIDKRNVLKPDVLSAEQEEQQKIKTRIELDLKIESNFLLSHFLRAVLLQRPVDIFDFAKEHFSDPNLRSNTLSKLDKTGDSE